MPPGNDLTPDGVLLGKYADARDEAAFELLVRRHGAMVWSAAQRILRDGHAAEDVMQAAFLALARKANALRGSTTVAGWLYRVSIRMALRVRPKARPGLPRTDADGDPAAAIERDELIAVVDEEVNRLPERLQQAVVLCCLSGLSTDEAAQRLGSPRGTILSRLHAAREKLRQQLSRRGFEAPAIGPLLAQCGPAPLTSSLIAVALRAAGPATALSPVAITLAQGALTAMLITKSKAAALVLFAVAGLGVGASHWAGTVPGEPPTAKEKSVAAKVEETPDVRIARLQAREAEEKKVQEIARDLEMAQLARAETNLWEVIQKGQDERYRLQIELLQIGNDEDSKLRLDAINTVSRKNLEKLYEIKPAKELRERIGYEKPGHADVEIKIIEATLATLDKERKVLRDDLIAIATRRQRLESQIKQSELRELLELEKFRKLLK